MKFEIFNKNESNLKVAFFNKKTFGTTLLEHKNVDAIATHNNLEIHLFDIEIVSFVNFKSYKDHALLDKNQEVQTTYRYILDYIKKNNIKICIFFGSGYPWTKNFLEELKKFSYAACYFGDDPEGAEYTSKYYVKNFDYAFCGGIYFDENTKIEEKYIEWGAKKCKFIPLGANPTKYREFIEFNNRNVDLVYVGGAYLKKIIRMFMLKKHFGDRMLIFGRGWNGMSKNPLKLFIIGAIKWFYNVPLIEELPTDKLVELYNKSKIGFNIHMSHGPSNLRMYELPMNGVMQICDCEKGLKELYEIDKEVVSYKNINEAINKIEYYLKNDDRRISIAKAGHERAKKDYRLEKIFEKILNEINKDINEK